MKKGEDRGEGEVTGEVKERGRREGKGEEKERKGGQHLRQSGR